MNPDNGKKDLWLIYQPSGVPFSSAGVWSHNDKFGVTSCSIVTMLAGNPMSKLHDRQPVIRDPAVYKDRLDPAKPGAKAKELLKENLDDKLEFHRVSRDVNSSRFDGKPLPEINTL